MNPTLALLTRWKDFHQIESDYAAAKRLGVTRATVSNWRHGRHAMDDETALVIATDIGADPLAVLAQLRAASATDPRKRAVWERYCARVSVAALVALAVATGNPRAQLLTSEDCYHLREVMSIGQLIDYA